MSLRAGAAAGGGHHPLPGGPDEPDRGVLPPKNQRRCPGISESHHGSPYKENHPDG